MPEVQQRPFFIREFFPTGTSVEKILPTTCVGDGAPIKNRLTQHHNKKDFWDWAVFFLAKDCKKMVVELLEKKGEANREDIDSLLRKKLSDALTEEQKTNSIRNLLQEMRRDGTRTVFGNRLWWSLRTCRVQSAERTGRRWSAECSQGGSADSLRAQSRFRPGNRLRRISPQSWNPRPSGTGGRTRPSPQE